MQVPAQVPAQGPPQEPSAAPLGHCVPRGGKGFQGFRGLGSCARPSGTCPFPVRLVSTRAELSTRPCPVCTMHCLLACSQSPNYSTTSQPHLIAPLPIANEEKKRKKKLTSSPSTYVNAKSLASAFATVVFPHAVGPVTNQIHLCSFLGFFSAESLWARRWPPRAASVW